jgi:glyoxylase-like metal-dependent hydrolase (beta-lactamase superfamily II)
MHTPGHSRGHLALLDARSGSLLVADAVSEPGPHPPVYFDALVYRDTLRRIGALDAGRLLGCHYPVQEGTAARALVERAMAYIDDCDAAVREAFAQAHHPLSLANVAGALLTRMRIGEEPRRWVWAAQGHVAALERQGGLVRRDRGDKPAWEMRQ